MACTRDTARMLSKNTLARQGLDSSLLKTDDFLIDYSNGSERISITYLGSGGYYLGTSNSGILIDPFFSHQPFLTLPFRKISTIPEDVAFGLSPIRSKLALVEGVFISHSHYDHLMDVPYVFKHFLDTTKQSLKVYGSESTKNIMGSVLTENRLQNIEGLMADDESVGEWIYLEGGELRVLPIRSRHAPHFKRLVSVSFYGGQGKSIKGYGHELAKTRAGDWKLGQPMAYLVDILDDGYVRFRVYIQSSSVDSSDSEISKKVLGEAPVNLAILGAASFSNVKDYPNGLIEMLAPQKIVIGHWEDFFNPYQDTPKRTVRFTNISKFLVKLNGVFPWMLHGEEQFYMPVPGVSIEVSY